MDTLVTSTPIQIITDAFDDNLVDRDRSIESNPVDCRVKIFVQDIILPEAGSELIDVSAFASIKPVVSAPAT